MHPILTAILVLCGLGAVTSVVLLIADRLLCNYGTCTIRVNDGKRQFAVTGGGTLLSALYDQELFIPSACGGKGTCGYCKVRLPGGEEPLTTELPYLTRGEIRRNTRLACQVKVKTDLDVYVRDDYLDVRRYTARLGSARMLTHDTRELTVELVDPAEMEFRPGQYVQVCAPGPDGPAWRAYSISSPPSRAGRIELVVRLVPGGIGSTYLHELRPGEELTLTGPYGEFDLDDDDRTEIVCVGGGCGMAPMMSIITDLYERRPGRSCWLFFGARRRDDLLYYDELTELACREENFHVCFALSDADDDAEWTGDRGFIHESVWDRLDAGGRRQAFLCGPEAMIDATVTVLRDKGVPRDQVFFDAF